jgi:hypothetical protein
MITILSLVTGMLFSCQETRHHRGAADEGAEQGGEARQAAGEGEATEGDCRQV